jgi:hypothetical protein
MTPARNVGGPSWTFEEETFQDPRTREIVQGVVGYRFQNRTSDGDTITQWTTRAIVSIEKIVPQQGAQESQRGSEKGS